jgi:acyl dehydratase
MTVKGLEGDEKIFVGVERRVAAVDETESEEDIRRRVWAKREDEPADAVVIERRNLVFMKDKTPQQAQADREKPVRIVKGKYTCLRYVLRLTWRLPKGPANPEFSHTILPSRALLFRFSALTFNAHSIHLDRSYARDVEGYDDVLVHGPLTLTLILTVVQRHLSKLGKTISGIEYRNLAPLIVEQPLRICAKPKEVGKGASWEVWVERGDGGLAVRGTIKTRES